MKKRLLLSTLLPLLAHGAIADTYAPFDGRTGTWNVLAPGFFNTAGFLVIDLTPADADADLGVADTCTGRLHVWGAADALNSLVFYTDAAPSPTNYGTYCIPIGPGADGVTPSTISLTFSDADCGETRPEASGLVRVTSSPVASMSITSASQRIPGCIARIDTTGTRLPLKLGYEFGGLALGFGDGFFVGKSYMAGYFQSLADGYAGAGSPFGSAMAAVVSHQVFGYLITVSSPGQYTPPVPYQ